MQKKKTNRSPKWQINYLLCEIELQNGKTPCKWEHFQTKEVWGELKFALT